MSNQEREQTPRSITTSAPTSDPNPFPNLRRRRRPGLRMATGAAVALGLAVGGGAVAGAATSNATATTTSPTAAAGAQHGAGGTPPTAMGVVKSVGTDTFTLTAHDGTTVTVDVSSATSYLDRGVSSASLADVKVGALVAVSGSETADTVTATKVFIGGPGGLGGPGGRRWTWRTRFRWHPSGSRRNGHRGRHEYVHRQHEEQRHRDGQRDFVHHLRGLRDRIGHDRRCQGRHAGSRVRR